MSTSRETKILYAYSRRKNKRNKFLRQVIVVYIFTDDLQWIVVAQEIILLPSVPSDSEQKGFCCKLATGVERKKSSKAKW